ncbi:hypothetical protein OsJ_30131 [Oryza sativa Japonica Group]|uniref:Uncharacterized protein n=1 Tax=Oryza sativa subsp. japonica TaxID=39947 RepID=B9G4R8_ORYSJ|nr:hypothetical protein OsJ_30131 [Oryza sativa Japonica Group]
MSRFSGRTRPSSHAGCGCRILISCHEQCSPPSSRRELGVSPPASHRRCPDEIAPPPRGRLPHVIVHLDEMEDWTPGPPCSPSSGVSGLPSSDLSDLGGPIPTVRTFQWYLGCADGTQPPRRRAAARRGCRAPPQRREDPEDDEDDDGRRRHAEDIPPRRRSLRDVIIGRGQSVESRAAEGARHRSRTPHPSGRQRAHGDGRQGRSRTRHNSRCSCRCRSRRTRSPSSLTPRGQDGTGDAGDATTKVVAVSGQADGDQ